MDVGQAAVLVVTLELGERVVIDSPWHGKHNGCGGVVVRTFVRTQRERSCCGRDECDALCDWCDSDGAYWHVPSALVDVRTDKGVTAVDAGGWLSTRVHGDGVQLTFGGMQ